MSELSHLFIFICFDLKNFKTSTHRIEKLRHVGKIEMNIQKIKCTKRVEMFWEGIYWGIIAAKQKLEIIHTLKAVNSRKIDFLSKFFQD